MEQVAAIGAFLKGLLPGAFGAFISLRISQDNATKLNRFVTFICGIAIAHLLGGALIEHYQIPLDSMMATSIKVILGIFGMASITQAYIQLPSIIEALRKKFTGN